MRRQGATARFLYAATPFGGQPRIDGFAALLSAIIVFVFKAKIAQFLHLSESLLTILSVISLAYACYSLFIALQQLYSKRLLQLLVFCNSLYAILCLFLAFNFYTSTFLGAIYLTAESLVVAALAFIEWKVLKQNFS